MNVGKCPCFDNWLVFSSIMTNYLHLSVIVFIFLSCIINLVTWGSDNTNAFKYIVGKLCR